MIKGNVDTQGGWGGSIAFELAGCRCSGGGHGSGGGLKITVELKERIVQAKLHFVIANYQSLSCTTNQYLDSVYNITTYNYNTVKFIFFLKFSFK